MLRCLYCGGGCSPDSQSALDARMRSIGFRAYRCRSCGQRNILHRVKGLVGRLARRARR